MGKKILRTANITLKAILGTVLALLLLYNAYVLISRYAFGKGIPTVFGYGCATVVSGSMEPEIKIGDLIITKACGDYDQGDIITFYDAVSGGYITHRIILVTDAGYSTKGDANDSGDAFTVPRDAVVGKTVAVLGGFGNAVGFLQSPAGIFTVIAVGLAVIAAMNFAAEVTYKRKHEDEN